MIDNAVKEQITALAKRHGAARPDGTAPPVYFRVDGGKNKRKVHKASARLDPYPDTEQTAHELIRRAEGVAEEHKWVKVRAMAVGDSQPIETVTFEGEPDIDDDDDDDKVPRGPHAAAEALARVALGQHRLINDYANRLEQIHGEIAESQVQRALYHYHSEALQLAGKDGMLREVVGALGPQIVAQFPEVLRIAAAYAANQPIPPPAGAETPPEEPAAAIGWHVDRIVASAQGLQQVAQDPAVQDPAVQAAALGQLARLRQVVVWVAPLVGLQVVQPGQQQAQQQPPPPPPPPPADETPPTQETP